MRARERLALTGALLLSSALMTGPLAVPAADAAIHVVAAPGSGAKPDRPQAKVKGPGNKGNKGNGNKRNERNNGEAGGGEGRPGSGNDKPEPRPKDRRPPAVPALGGIGVGPGGAVSLPVTAESGSSVVVAEQGGGVVATGTGTGSWSSLSWTATNGRHSYVVTASDRAGNRSRPAQTSVAVDALPPRLARVRITPGTPSDTRTRVAFGTDTGAAYRIWVDGRARTSGRTAGPRAVVLVDLPDGRHRVEVVVRDAIGNARSATRRVAVRIPELAVRTQVTTDPTEGTQAVRVRTTPTARRGAARVPGGKGARSFVLLGGVASVELDLRDGTYRGGTVVVRDRHGRTGRVRIPVLRVDTSPPVLDVRYDEDAAAHGTVSAAVTAEAGADVRWRVVERDGDVVDSGTVTLTDGEGSVTADVDTGTYRFVVAATDGFDRTTRVRTTARIADDPWPAWVAVSLRVILGVGVALALTGLLLLLRGASRRGSRVRSTAVALGRAVRSRVRTFLGPVPEGDAAATVAALFEPPVEPLVEPLVEPSAGAPRMPAPRLPGRSGGTLPPDGEVLHRTQVRVYETTEERAEGPVVGSRTAQLVLARERFALVDDRSGDVWSGRIADHAHLRDDTTVVLPEGAGAWIGLVYGDPDLTRPALDLVGAEHRDRRLTPVGSAPVR